MSDILWRRLRYMLSPQWDIYHHIAPKLKGCVAVVDIGCGTGLGAVQLTRFVRSVCGWDVDSEAISFARACFPQVYWAVADITQPVIAGAFEAAVMVEALEHIEDYNRALENVRALLRPGGKLYITARNANADLRPNGLHLREWTAMEFARVLETHFDRVELWSWDLAQPQDSFTRATPLVAVGHA